MKTHTPYGTVHTHGASVRISATRDQLWTWAHRTGSSWPCSTLLELPGGWAVFEANGDLVDLSPGWSRADIDGVEFSAWEEDTRTLAHVKALLCD